jgi:hypothetical protein
VTTMLVTGLEAATRSPIVTVVDAGLVVGDAPGRSGSENRHGAVRVSSPQYVHSQVVASEYRGP